MGPKIFQKPTITLNKNDKMLFIEGGRKWKIRGAELGEVAEN